MVTDRQKPAWQAGQQGTSRAFAPTPRAINWVSWNTVLVCKCAHPAHSTFFWNTHDHLLRIIWKDCHDIRNALPAFATAPLPAPPPRYSF